MLAVPAAGVCVLVRRHGAVRVDQNHLARIRRILVKFCQHTRANTANTHFHVRSTDVQPSATLVNSAVGLTQCLTFQRLPCAIVGHHVMRVHQQRVQVRRELGVRPREGHKVVVQIAIVILDGAVDGSGRGCDHGKEYSTHALWTRTHALSAQIRGQAAQKPPSVQMSFSKIPQLNRPNISRELGHFRQLRQRTNPHNILAVNTFLLLDPQLKPKSRPFHAIAPAAVSSANHSSEAGGECEMSRCS